MYTYLQPMFWKLSFLLFWFSLIGLIVGKPSTTSESLEPTPSTIVDILSSEVEYSYFLRHLQRNGMVPILNSLSNITLLAPVNLAFTSESQEYFDRDLPYDNNILLRYVINQKFRVGYLSTEKVIFNTLYDVNGSPYPVAVSPDFNLDDYLIDDTAAIIETDIHAKHQDSFIQAIDSLLPVKPSLCEALMRNDDKALGPYLLTFMRLLFDQLFQDHGENSETEYKNYLNIIGNEKGSLRKLPKSCEEFMSRTKTMFILTDSYVYESVPEITRRYLSSLKYCSNKKKCPMTKEAILEVKYDIVDFLETFMIDELIGGVNGTSGSYKSINEKSEFNISPANFSNQILLNNKIVSAINATSLAMSNGMLHVFDLQNQTYQSFFEDLNIPLVPMIPRKALYAMQFTNFVKELNFRSLHHLVDGSTNNQTIFVESFQRDAISDESFSHSDLQSSYFGYKESVYYQFANEMIDIEHTMKESNYANFYKLLDSKLCSQSKIGSCFKAKFSATYNTDLKSIDATINDETNIMFPGIKTTNNNIIYLTKQEVYPPSYLKQTLLKLLLNGGVSRHLDNFEIDRKSFLNTLKYLEQFGLLSLPENKKGYSIFLPCGYSEQNKRGSLKNSNKFEDPWKELGLVLKFLEANPVYFKDILKGLFIEDTIYSDFGLAKHENETVSKTLRGDDVVIRNSYFDDLSNHLITLNSTELLVPLNSDILFDQGIVHVVDKVLLPESFRISYLDLLRTTDDPNYPQFSILNLIDSYPKLSDALGITDEKVSPGYSLLVPTPESLKDFNITSDFTNLCDFLEFHLIPNTELNKLLSCINSDIVRTDNMLDTGKAQYSIKTNISDAVLECERNPYNKKIFLRLMLADISVEDKSLAATSYNKDKEVQIVSHGCTVAHANNSVTEGACVFLIDKPLNLKWLEDSNKDTFLHIHIGLISVGIGIILGLLLFGLLVFGMLLFLGRSKIEQPPGSSFESNEDDLQGSKPSYMRIQPDEDNHVFDYGYETDDDIFNAEDDHLLPIYGKRPKRKSYGSIGHNESTTAPVSIKGSNITKALNRERNLPGGAF